MLCDKPFQRSRHPGIDENDGPIDLETDGVSNHGAGPGSRVAMHRNGTDRLHRCPYCGSESIYRWGKSDTGIPRGRCRVCERTFSPRTGTWLAGIRETDKFANVLDDMLIKTPGSCRRLADVLEVDKMTVWHWRRRISQALLGPEPALQSAPLEVHDEPIRESRKGSREWVDHHRDPARHPAPNRPRWVDVDRHGLLLPHALIAYQLQVLITAAEGGCQPIVAPLVCPSAARHFCDTCEANTHHAGARVCRCSASRRDARHAEEVAVPSAIHRPLAAAFPAARNKWLVGCSAPTPSAAASRAEPGARDRSVRVEQAAPATSSNGTINGVLHSLQQPTPDCLAAAFRAFLRPFAGPAAKYLEAYAAWFIKRLEGSDEGRLERAWALLVA